MSTNPRKRNTKSSHQNKHGAPDPHQASLHDDQGTPPPSIPTTASSSAASNATNKSPEMENLSKKSQWIVLAIASGACASFNGVFAKLTTTEQTTSFATWVATTIGLSSIEGGVEFVVRVIFFLLNLLFNFIMWTLFTKALARGTSTTQVSILNTSANFLLTAFLGALIFAESLPPLWFGGAALLVAGNVIIGRRDEGEKDGRGEYEQVGAEGARRSVDTVDGDGQNEVLVGGLGEVVDLDDLERRRKNGDDEDILQLDSEENQEARDDMQLL